jgi:hypothetical protein
MDKDGFDYVSLLTAWGARIDDENKFDRLVSGIGNAVPILERYRISYDSFLFACSEAGIRYDESLDSRITVYNKRSNKNEKYLTAATIVNVLHSKKHSLPEYIVNLLCLVNKTKYIESKARANVFRLVKKALDMSMIPVNILISGDDLIVYPANSKLLDGVVEDVLSVLHLFPQSFVVFRKAIEMYMEGGNDRGVVDSFRLSLELLVKEKLTIDKSLDNALPSIGDYLKGSGINKEVRNGFFSLVEIYNKYNNENSKHNSKVQKNEVEFILNMTATFMRLILTADME